MPSPRHRVVRAGQDARAARGVARRGVPAAPGPPRGKFFDAAPDRRRAAVRPTRLQHPPRRWFCLYRGQADIDAPAAVPVVHRDGVEARRIGEPPGRPRCTDLPESPDHSRDLWAGVAAVRSPDGDCGCRDRLFLSVVPVFRPAAAERGAVHPAGDSVRAAVPRSSSHGLASCGQRQPARSLAWLR